MSEEEKKAIESLIEIREFANLSSYKDVRINQLNAIDIILNLIEKQSKEIEDLKEKNKSIVYNYEMVVDKLENSTPNDKIKAKLEEYDDKGMIVNLANRSAGKTFQQAVHYEVKKVLQSLIEKE